MKDEIKNCEAIKKREALKIRLHKQPSRTGEQSIKKNKNKRSQRQKRKGKR